MIRMRKFTKLAIKKSSLGFYRASYSSRSPSVKCKMPVSTCSFTILSLFLMGLLMESSMLPTQLSRPPRTLYDAFLTPSPPVSTEAIMVDIFI